MNKKIIILSVSSLLLLLIIVIGVLNYLNSSYLTIETNPSEANITLDNSSLKSPLINYRLKSGGHKIVAQQEGYFDETVNVALKPKEKKSLSIKLGKNITDILPENNSHFKIKLIDNNTYAITLYAILNRPDQLDSYNAQLKEYHDEALKWLKDKEVDTSSIKIKWDPEEKYIPK